MSIERAEFEPWIPHAGAMCLLDRVLSWDETRLEAETDSHRLADNPLRRDGRLAALHALEYGAQGMAVHGGLLARADDAAVEGGFLAAGRGVRFHVARLDDLPAPLTIAVEREFAQAGNLIYQFRVTAGTTAVADGQAIVVAT